METAGKEARVELGEGIVATCQLPQEISDLAKKPNQSAKPESNKADLSSLTSMLQARWKGATSVAAEPEPIRQGQIRKFRITSLDSASKKIEVALS